MFTYIRYIWFVNKSTKFNNSKYCYVALTIQLNISPLLALSLNVKQFPTLLEPHQQIV